MPREKRKFLIDTDTASDDAVALIMAMGAPDVDIVAITTVAGNVNVEQATSNALFTAELCNSDVPVYPGAERPLQRLLEDATWFHGRDGLGDLGYSPARRQPEPGHAVDAILAAIEMYPSLEIVTLGPLTNIALALESRPEIAGRLKRCVVMGGAPCCVGNVTPAAEYNFWTDPEAGRAVLRSGMLLDLVGWHLCRGEAVLSESEIRHVLSLGTGRADFAIRCNGHARRAYLEQTGEDGISLPDPTAMAIALNRTLGTHWSRHHVDVETASELTRGMTVADQLNVSGNPRNATVWAAFAGKEARTEVCWTLDVSGWKAALYRALAPTNA